MFRKVGQNQRSSDDPSVDFDADRWYEETQAFVQAKERQKRVTSERVRRPQAGVELPRAADYVPDTTEELPYYRKRRRVARLDEVELNGEALNQYSGWASGAPWREFVSGVGGTEDQ